MLWGVNRSWGERRGGLSWAGEFEDKEVGGGVRKRERAREREDEKTGELSWKGEVADYSCLAIHGGGDGAEGEGGGRGEGRGG